ncbi:MAG: nicotinate-nucleotide adenylyltransferase [Deltaproteobacteria bacterium]|nr:nicotinate-nucleotide adenylyltransferase [Deltaproteobacteria bacterium]
MSAPPRRPPLRVGVFGGTFDPIHLGHLRCAEEARELLRLDRVLFIPLADPPHKTRRITPAAHRLAMVKLAIRDQPAFRASSIELQRRGKSYTIDTLRALRARLPNARTTLLVGLDAFREIDTWKDWRTLLGLTDIAVWSRPPGRIGAARTLLPVAARGDFCYGTSQSELVHDTGTRIRFLTVTALDISASAIRQRIQRGRSVRYLVPASVERYLQRVGLYRKSRVSA